MRFNPKKDYGEISRRSIRREMQQQRQTFQPHSDGKVVRLVRLNETSYYWRYRSLVVNRLFRVLGEELGGKEVEFVNDNDRQAPNRAAEWSDQKRTYIIDGARYE